MSPYKAQICVAWILLLPLSIHAALGGMTGTRRATRGYYSAGGTGPMCWVTPNAISTANETQAAISLHNSSKATAYQRVDDDVVNNFYTTTTNTNVVLLHQCPVGISLNGYAPPPLYSDGIKSQGREKWTNHQYNYTVVGTLNISSLLGTALISDRRVVPSIKVLVTLCDYNSVGFCAPDVEDDVNGSEGPDAEASRKADVKAFFKFVGFPALSKNQTFATESSVVHFEVVVPVVIKDAGNYFCIVAIKLFTANSTLGIPAYKYDIANAMDIRLANFDDFPTVLSVTPVVNIIMLCIISVAAAAQFAMLLYAVYHRNSKVMKLTQGWFLITFTAVALLATVSSIFFNPKNDIYCISSGPMVLVSLQVMYAITAGRLWRINAIISPILKASLRSVKRKKRSSVANQLSQLLTWVSTLSPSRCAESMRHVAACAIPPKRRSFQIAVTHMQLVRVILLFVIPMIIVQAFSLSFEPKSSEILFAVDLSCGKRVCVSSHRIYGTLDILSLVMLFSLFLVVLLMAYESRNLPSLLCETRNIYSAALYTMTVVTAGFFAIAAGDTPTTSPNVTFVLSVVMTITITSNMTCAIMMPKFRAIWNNVDVRMSTLISDQRSDKRRSAISVDSPTNTPPELHAKLERSGSDQAIEKYILSIESATNTPQNGSEQALGKFNQERNPAKSNKAQEKSALGDLSEKIMLCVGFDVGDVGGEVGDDSSFSVSDCVLLPQVPNGSVGEQSLASQRAYNPEAIQLTTAKSGEKSIRVTVDDGPPPRLLVRMLTASDLIQTVSHRLMSGMVVEKEEWEQVRDLCGNLGHLFTNDVLFDWEDITANTLFTENSDSRKALP